MSPGAEPLRVGILGAARIAELAIVKPAHATGTRPLSQVTDGFVGEAFTMRFIPMREDVDGLDPYRSGNTLQWTRSRHCSPARCWWSTPTAPPLPPPAATC